MSIRASAIDGAGARGETARRGWWARAATVIAFGALMAAGVQHASQRYRLALDVQKYYTCLPFDAYLVDTEAHGTISRGTLVQFVAPTHATLFTGAYEVVKLVAAVAGDRWRIEDDELYVNDRLWGRLYLLQRLGLRSGELDASGVVPEGSVMVLGTTPSSYDSRYWGPLPVANITGIAHVVL
jgi:conjugal transfer pilin signal peptidase TrbI